MSGVPVVGAPASLAAQVGTDPPGAEHHGTLQLVLVFLGLGDRPPAAIFVGDRSDELAVAMPAALADVDLAAQPQGVAAVLVQPVSRARPRPPGGGRRPR